MSDTNALIKHIMAELEQFGMVIKKSETQGNLSFLTLIDTVNDTTYACIVTVTSNMDWHYFIIKNLVPYIKNLGSKLTPPTLAIVPSNEAESLFQELLREGIRANLYHMFNGFTMLGISRKDSTFLLEKDFINIENNEYNKTSNRTVLTNKRSWILFFGLILISFTVLLVYKFISNYSPEHKIIETIVNDAANGREGNDDVLYALAESAPLSQFDMYMLSKQGYKAQVAKNPYISMYTMQQLSRNNDPNIRSGVALNSKLTTEIADKLGNDTSSKVRASVATNKALSHSAMEKLARDKEYIVRSSLLGNPNITDEMIDIIEPNPNTAGCESKEKIFARQQLNQAFIEYNVNNPDPCVRRGIASNPSIKETFLIELSNDADLSVRMNVVNNPSISVDLVELLTQKYFQKGWEKDPNKNNYAIRQALMKNKLQNKLFKGFDIEIASNPSTKYSNLKKIYFQAIPVYGVNNFLKKVNEMPKNKDLIHKLSETRFYSANKWQELLRQKINEEFATSVYDPITILEIILPNSIDSGSKDLKKLSLYDIEDEGEFFSKRDRDVATANEITTFKEYFGDISQNKTATKIVSDADAIIDEVLEKLTPAIEKSMDQYDNLKSTYSDDVTVSIIDNLVLDKNFRTKILTKISR